MWKSPVARWHLVNRDKTAEEVKKTRKPESNRIQFSEV